MSSTYNRIKKFRQLKRCNEATLNDQFCKRSRFESSDTSVNLPFSNDFP